MAFGWQEFLRPGCHRQFDRGSIDHHRFLAHILCHGLQRLMNLVERQGQNDHVCLFDGGGQAVPHLLHRPHLVSLAGDFRRCIVPDRGDLILVVRQRQPDRGADLSQSNNG